MIMKNSNALDQLFSNNREWAEAMVAKDSNFFKRLVSQQAPEYLWIGCSDSRVPANEIVNLLPGELFVHRNVANVVVHTDLNCLSVIQFAIDLLKVKHILVVGHYGCSGVHTAMTDRRVGLADNWLRHVKDVHQKHERYLGDAIPSPKRQDRLCELNVIEQVVNVCETTIVQDAWSRGQDLTVHGWAYRLETGLVNDLGMSISSDEEMHRRYATSLSRYDSN
ncbi:MAG: carbonate dehydratase [Polynucleobacter sp. 24-46-87]|jgi:carbonic anhydrase|uniref:carbonate dehydratase n=1 Tax=unclassified Polynucleobacter TaxID=2640945 RepID=UPI000BD967F3|nr:MULTISPECIES: carbonate dehydratase [unclassified Polynucleobacter]OYY10609.1 MAG: carbonate dehydratase [Polynucleobacter sp. 35-46-11]OZA12787.1 MAG: carbonate dehydratase [Polynucleobacter sp. 24-46-87]OZA73933.1 MAG: carbonate dehydratase [Polynucleobacter sp. 39-46-10]QWE22568.1 carbonate dehydratase [Polynucleobacter sp. AP-Jannik-300A-C4]